MSAHSGHNKRKKEIKQVSMLFKNLVCHASNLKVVLLVILPDPKMLASESGVERLIIGKGMV